MYKQGTSICICTYNKVEPLKKTLDSVIQNCVDPYEIVIVDDNSSNTEVKQLLLKFKEQYKEKVTLHFNEVNLQHAASQNLSFDLASYDTLVHLEDDMILEPKGWNQAFRNFLTQHQEVGLVGPITSIRGDVINRGNYYEGMWLLGGIWAVPKRIYDEIGGWDSLWHQVECDYCLRIRLGGYRITELAQVRATHLCEGYEQETPKRKAQLHVGVHNFLKKWNKRFFGTWYYTSPASMSWDDFPINEFFRRQCCVGLELNKNPEQIVLPRNPECTEHGWGKWDVIKKTRPVGREDEQTLLKLVKENHVFKDGELLEERMKGREYEDIAKGKEDNCTWIYVDNETLKKLKELNIKFRR